LPFGWGAEIDKDKIWDVNVDLFTRLLPYAEKYGVTICAENQPFTAIAMSTVKEVKKLIREINHPQFKACLDTGHSACLGDSPSDAVYLLGKEYLATMHVHDNDGTRDQHLEPGRGVIDWDAFRKALADIGFDGTLSIESNVPKELSDEERAVYPARIADIAKQLAKDI
jgi:sugar phosphate isomerase/epimerase